MENILDNFKTIDITDKTILQEQFNYCRKQYFNCIESMDEVNKKISSLKEEVMNITVELYSDVSLSNTAAAQRLKADSDYQEKILEIDCYEKSLGILEEKLNFIKSDIRILSNSMYNKF